MKLNRSLVITIVIAMLMISTGLLLGGCASIADGKDDGPEEESPGRIDKQSTTAEETGVSSPDVREESVASTGSPSENQSVQEANFEADQDRLKDYAASLIEALDRILPVTLSELNWNRIATVFTGILLILTIYGFAFWLGRRPLRRRGAGRRGLGRQIGEQARGSVSR